MGALGAGGNSEFLRGSDIDKLGEDLARALVRVAREFSGRVVHQGEGEPMVNRIYVEALSMVQGTG